MEKLRATNFVGKQGSWHAEVTYDNGESENLPCVHEHFWKTGGGGPYYLDPVQTPTCKGNQSQKHWNDLRRMRRVILTKDEVIPGQAPGNGRFRRTGYIGVFDIADAECNEENGLYFRFVARVA